MHCGRVLPLFKKMQWLPNDEKKHAPLLPVSHLDAASSYEYKNICTWVAKFMAASSTFYFKWFPCLSQLSRPSAVCFLLTFSSCAQTLPEELLTEPGLWEWAGSQHWPEISSSNWISRRGGSHYPYTEVGSEKNIAAVSWNFPIALPHQTTCVATCR